MKFYHKKRRPPTLAIVSLIDILAILLIFFIVTTTFKTEESLVKVSLPRSAEMAKERSGERRVALALDKEGRVSLGERILPLEELAGALGQFRVTRPGDRLELKADEGAPLGLLVRVWDAATQAGLKIDDLPLRIRLED